MKCEKCGRPCYGTDFHEIDEKGNTVQILCKHCFNKSVSGEKTEEKEIDFNMWNIQSNYNNDTLFNTYHNSFW